MIAFEVLLLWFGVKFPRFCTVYVVYICSYFEAAVPRTYIYLV